MGPNKQYQEKHSMGSNAFVGGRREPNPPPCNRLSKFRLHVVQSMVRNPSFILVPCCTHARIPRTAQPRPKTYAVPYMNRAGNPVICEDWRVAKLATLYVWSNSVIVKVCCCYRDGDGILTVDLIYTDRFFLSDSPGLLEI